MTDYVVNTAGLVFQQAGVLNETITPSMVSLIKLHICTHVSSSLEDSLYYYFLKINLEKIKSCDVIKSGDEDERVDTSNFSNSFIFSITFNRLYCYFYSLIYLFIYFFLRPAM